MDNIFTQLAAGLAIIVTILNAIISLRKSKSDITSQITDAATSLIEPLQNRIKELETQLEKTRANELLYNKQIAEIEYLSERITDLEQKDAEKTARIVQLETEVFDLINGVELLVNQVRDLGHEPVYIPRKTRGKT